MGLAGYLVNKPAGLEGERGLAYDYILAGNGLFIRAMGRHLEAQLPVAPALVRGLPELPTVMRLPHGKIPLRLWDLTLDAFLADPEREFYVAVVWDGAAYRPFVPIQTTTGASIEYEKAENVVLELHSHGRMGAFFSGTDDADELGLKLFGVVGRLDDFPVVRLRAGAYGNFAPVEWGEVFAGNLTGALRAAEVEGDIDDLLPADD